MIRALSLLVPWALLGLFVYKALHTRIFLLGVPFLIYMDSSVYFDSMRIFHTPGRLSGYLQLLGWLVITWALIVQPFGAARDQPAPGQPLRAAAPHRTFLVEEIALLAIAALALSHAAAIFSQTGDLGDAAGRALPTLTMIIGYYLVRDIVARTPAADMMRFVATLVLVSALASGLYVVHEGLHISVYPGADYYQTYFEGSLITRTFTFAPRFGLVFLAVAFIAAARRWTLAWGAVLAITLLGVWVSYTRSLLFAVGVAVALSVLAYELKHPSSRRLTRRLVLTVCLAGVAAFTLFAVLPTQSRYFEQRLSSLNGSQGVRADSSFFYRATRLSYTVSLLERNGDLTFGEGFPTARQDPNAPSVAVWGEDMAWLLVLYAFGLAGVVAFAALFVGFGARALWLFKRATDRDSEHLALTCFAALVAVLLTSLISRSFMEPTVLPMSLWLFAFVGGLAVRGAEAPVMVREAVTV